MLWRKRKKTDVIQIDALIGQDMYIKGDVAFSGGLHVDGKVQGDMTAEDGSGAILVLSERGSIEGDVRVPNVVLNGMVEGNIHAGEHVELGVNARVTGNVYYNLIKMAMGAEVNGNLIHHAEPKPDGTAKLQTGEVPPSLKLSDTTPN